MKKLFKLIFKNLKKSNSKTQHFEKLKIEKKTNLIFNAIEEYSNHGVARYVGGCVRKIYNSENVDDIDISTNLKPDEVCDALEKKKIKYYKTGYEHGTITAIINKINFEITSLREDISTDGRRAVVRFTTDWYKDAERRDFTINAIYADLNGNIFDPTNGKKDLEDGRVRFIGNAEERVKEDYLRIVRYIRFFISYSKHEHDKEIKRILKKNIKGITTLSNERLLDELRKIIKIENFLNFLNDKFSQEILLLVYPQIVKLNNLKLIKKDRYKFFNSKNSAFKLALLIIDKTNNTEFFLYKYNLSNEEKKKILFLKEMYLKFEDKNLFTEDNLFKIFYLYGKDFLIDLIDFRLLTAKTINKKILDIKNLIIDSEKPILPIKARDLIKKYNLKEGRDLGKKLRKIEEVWINNKFKISDNEIDVIIKD